MFTNVYYRHSTSHRLLALFLSRQVPSRSSPSKASSGWTSRRAITVTTCSTTSRYTCRPSWTSCTSPSSSGRCSASCCTLRRSESTRSDWPPPPPPPLHNRRTMLRLSFVCFLLLCFFCSSLYRKTADRRTTARLLALPIIVCHRRRARARVCMEPNDYAQTAVPCSTVPCPALQRCPASRRCASRKAW